MAVCKDTVRPKRNSTGLLSTGAARSTSRSTSPSRARRMAGGLGRSGASHEAAVSVSHRVEAHAMAVTSSVSRRRVVLSASPTTTVSRRRGPTGGTYSTTRRRTHTARHSVCTSEIRTTRGVLSTASRRTGVTRPGSLGSHVGSPAFRASSARHAAASSTPTGAPPSSRSASSCSPSFW